MHDCTFEQSALAETRIRGCAAPNNKTKKNKIKQKSW
jgi:hypothetical protein